MNQAEFAETFRDIEAFIWALSDFHYQTSIEWKDECPCQINFKHNLSRLYGDELFRYFKVYKFYADQHLMDLPSHQFQPKVSFTVEFRVKEWDSLTDKVDRYMNRSEKGKVPLKKCLNDTVGFRLCLTASPDREQLLQALKTVFCDSTRFRCTDAMKNDYTAIHVYIQESNFSPSWELQIWNGEDRENNLISHKTYKQNYTEYSERK